MGFHGLLRVSAGFHGLLRVSAGFHGLLRVSAGFHGLLRVSAGCSRSFAGFRSTFPGIRVTWGLNKLSR